MAKDGSSNNVEHFEPFCQWKSLQDSDILEVHLPEFKKEQMRVRITNNSLLTISGERVVAEDGKKIQFNREMKLSNSKDIYPDRIRAKFGGGVLSIIMPKKPSSVGVREAPKTQELDKPNDTTAVSDSKQNAVKDNSKPKKLIHGLRSSLSRLKFGKNTAAATVVAVVIVALGAYYYLT